MMPISSELLVAGGGVAGCCAAIAAARSGVRTLLVEQQGYLGGTGSAGMLQYICGLYLNGDSAPAETLNGGLAREIVRLLNEKAPDKKVLKIGQVYVLPYLTADLQDVLTVLVETEANLTVMRNAIVTGVETASGSIRSVTLEAPGGTQAIAANAVIDCTGSGDVAVMAGAEFELAPIDERQLGGFSFRVSGLKNRDETLSIKVAYCCARAVEQGLLPDHVKFTGFTCLDAVDEGVVKMSLGGEDAPDRDALARDNAYGLLDYLRRVLPAFSGAKIAEMTSRVQDREGRRIIGSYLLAEEDVLAARKFPDAIVKNAWPIELWDRSKGTLYRYIPQGDYYEIPFRCIIVKGITNLLTAGRCISVSAAALGSTRVMGTCMALGEQAGLAGAEYVANGKYKNR